MITAKERPILFNAPIVRSTLAGNKTNTRRTNGLEYFSDNEPGNWRCVRVFNGNAYFVYGSSPKERIEKCPYGQPGDHLWVWENCRAEELDDGTDGVRFLADDDFVPIRTSCEAAEAWHKLFNYRGQQGAVVPSIHMPRWAARILLEITDVRVERLQDGEGEVAWESRYLAEGIHKIDHGRGDHYYSAFRKEPHPENWADPFDAWRELWNSTGGEWEANPWVWVVGFRRMTRWPGT